MIGFRANRVGKSGKLLRRLGWQSSPAQINNILGVDYIIPCKTFDQFKAFDFKSLDGFNGMAFWFTDAQWSKNEFLTHKQWQCRVDINN